jgi:hypothetical protein
VVDKSIDDKLVGNDTSFVVESDDVKCCSVVFCVVGSMPPRVVEINVRVVVVAVVDVFIVV